MVVVRDRILHGSGRRADRAGAALDERPWSCSRVVQALVQAVAFAFVFNIFLVGAVGGIMSPDNGWNPLIRAIALIMAGIALRSVLGRLGLTSGTRGSDRVAQVSAALAGRHLEDRLLVRATPATPRRAPARAHRWCSRPGAALGGPFSPAALLPPRSAPGPRRARGLRDERRPALSARPPSCRWSRVRPRSRSARPAHPGVGTVASGTVIAGTLVRSSVTHQAASRALPGGRVAPSQTQSTDLAGAAASSGAGAAFSGRGGFLRAAYRLRLPSTTAGGGVSAPYRPASASCPTAAPSNRPVPLVKVPVVKRIARAGGFGPGANGVDGRSGSSRPESSRSWP